MLQVLQNLKDGATHVSEIPSPLPTSGRLLIGSSVTLVSAGTERMLVEFGKANWLQKARQQPDKVRMVLDKVRTDGLAATLDAVRSKLDEPLALGYCNVGRVMAVGHGVDGFSVGDRVVSNGGHAEIVSVPKNLCARVPDDVRDDQAAFTVLAAIGMQGIRLANVTMGECVVVTGLGLIGLLTVQMLRAQGCRVMGIDFDPERLKLARQFGAEVVNPAAGDDVLARAEAFSRGRGVDAVLITASTKSSEPVSLAARMSRKRGRIVLVGVTGLELSRADFFEKELSFQVSCSYGPGRYDPAYEQQGHDYPIGHVRWTEQRNFEAVLDLMAMGKLDTGPLISHRFALSDAAQAYDLLSSDEASLGILLEYQGIQSQDRDAPSQRAIVLDAARRPVAADRPNIAFLGAGNYAGRVLIPAFAKTGAHLHTIVSSGGVSAVHHGRKHGFAVAATDTNMVLGLPAIDAAVIATRHDAHARQVVAALSAGKHVFCEKPLCLTMDELSDIQAVIRKKPELLLMVGFNRRFAPLVVQMARMMKAVDEPKHFVLTVNAGDIPADHWTQDIEVGGGRIIGEACHFIDLLRHLAASPCVQFRATASGRHPDVPGPMDRVSITLEFADGSAGVIHYLANGHRSFPKERLEVFCGGRILQLDNFRTLRGWGWPDFRTRRLWRQDKGQAACAAAFVSAIRNGGPPPIDLDELIEVSAATISIANQLR